MRGQRPQDYGTQNHEYTPPPRPPKARPFVLQLGDPGGAIVKSLCNHSSLVYPCLLGRGARKRGGSMSSFSKNRTPFTFIKSYTVQHWKFHHPFDARQVQARSEYSLQKETCGKKKKRKRPNKDRNHFSISTKKRAQQRGYSPRSDINGPTKFANGNCQRKLPTKLPTKIAR